MREFVLPSLGADMDAGTVVEWLVRPGDEVARGDVVALVETEKGVIEVEIWEDGVIDEILVTPGTKVAVGTPLAQLREPAVAGAVRKSESSAGIARPPTRRKPVPAPTPVAAIRLVTPPMRHLAHELGVDLASVHGTGPEGSVTRADIRAAARVPAGARIAASPRARKVAADLGVDIGRVTAAHGGAITEQDVRLAAGLGAAATAPEPSVETQILRSAAPPDEPEQEAQERQRIAMRRAIADVMTRSKREIPHYYLGTSIDLTPMTTWLEAENAKRGVADRILPVVPLLKAAALGLRQVPEMNGFFVDGHYQPSEQIHLGVAISLRRGGLIAPAIHDADTLDLDELMAKLRDLVARTRSGRLRSSEMSDPTITITNLGDRGVETVFPVIYAPQVAIVGFGRITPRPWVVDGLLGIRPIVEATLAADHRVSDGHRGGLYLSALEKLLAIPEDL